jgi:hypothetical protein
MRRINFDGTSDSLLSGGGVFAIGMDERALDRTALAIPANRDSVV